MDSYNRHGGQLEHRGPPGVRFQHRRHRLDDRQLSLMIHAVAVASCLCIALVSDSPEVTLQSGGLIIFCTYIWLAVREGKDAPLILSPLTVFFAWFSVGYGLATFWAGKQVADGELIPFSVVYLDPRNLVPGFLVCIVGALALQVGIQLSRPPRLAAPTSPGDPPQQTRPLILLGIWGMALLVRVFPNESAWLGGLSGIIQWGGLSSLCLYVLTQARRQKHSRLLWPILLGGCALEMVLNLSSGSKAYLMFSFLPLIWLSASEQKLRLWLIPISAAFSLFYFGLVWPVVTQARMTTMKDGEGNAALILRVLQSEARGEINLEEGWKTFLYRQFEAAPTSFIYGEVEHYGLRYGSTLTYLGIGLVPRVLWPDKPAVNTGRWFDTYLAHNAPESDAGNCLSQTPGGELYWNFSWPGIVAGMLLLGVLVGWLWRMATPMPLQDPIKMLLYTQLSVLIFSFADAGVALMGLVQRVLVFGAILGLVAFWRRSSTNLHRKRGLRSSLLVRETVRPIESDDPLASPQRVG